MYLTNRRHILPLGILIAFTSGVMENGIRFQNTMKMDFISALLSVRAPPGETNCGR